MTDVKKIVDMIEGAGGKVKEIGITQEDNHGFMTASFPLPDTHWIYEDQIAPPMPFRMGNGKRKEMWREKIWAAGKYAVRASTMNGKEMDFDPDAMCQNLVVGMLGYFTEDGLTDDDWANPNPVPPIWEESND